MTEVTTNAINVTVVKTPLVLVTMTDYSFTASATIGTTMDVISLTAPDLHNTVVNSVSNFVIIDVSTSQAYNGPLLTISGGKLLVNTFYVMSAEIKL